MGCLTMSRRTAWTVRSSVVVVIAAIGLALPGWAWAPGVPTCPDCEGFHTPTKLVPKQERVDLRSAFGLASTVKLWNATTTLKTAGGASLGLKRISAEMKGNEG